MCSGAGRFAVTLESHRLRASAFAHTQGCSLALRLLPEQCPQLRTLGTPQAIPELLTRDNGLILVTGATGSGKSTTLAALVDYANTSAATISLPLKTPSNSCINPRAAS